jgi:rare lipoprotein A
MGGIRYDLRGPLARRLAVAAGLCAALALSGCGSDESRNASIPGFKVGSPYKINGVWYHPEIDFDYDEEGIASWYGPGFAGRPTASGETYDPEAITAAHTTLPMPTIVTVTNLENGRSMKVRINDRGPFHDGRIIDVSRKVAHKLGFERNGTARVRVAVVKDESRRLYAMAQGRSKGGAPLPDGVVMTASAQPYVPSVTASRAASAKLVAMQPIPDPVEQPTTAAISYRAVAPRPAAEPAAPAIVTTANAVPVSQSGVKVTTTPVTVAELDPPAPAPTAVATQDGQATAVQQAVQALTLQPAAQAAPATGRPIRLVPTGRLAKPGTVQAAAITTAPAAVLSQSQPVPVGLYVQAGSFVSYANAQRTQAMLTSVGITRISPSIVGGTQYYRVRVGPLETREQADVALAQVVASGLPDARILQE